MNMPGFTAEQSIYRNGLPYRMAGVNELDNVKVQPAAKNRCDTLAGYAWDALARNDNGTHAFALLMMELVGCFD
jgi:hypothetical protein